MRMDLHTHCREATGSRHANLETVRKIVARVKAQGLDGIAVTEHDDKNYGYEVKDIVERFFPGEVLIIPGQEVRRGLHHMVELYLPGDTTFRFIAHPGNLSTTFGDNLDGIHGLEIENGNCVIDTEKAREFAQRHGLLLLSNSDAHTLSDIGRHYNEITIDELSIRARRGASCA